MSGFLYFIPRDVTRAADLAGFGLAYAFEQGAPGLSFCTCRNGPGGMSGTVVGDDRAGKAIGYYPDKQTWRKRPETRQPGDEATGQPGSQAAVWVGIYNDARPKPADLLRSDALAGHAVRLCDGNDWIIPVARAATEQGGELRYFAKLPRRLDFDENGRWMSSTIVDRYQRLWDVACSFWNSFTGAGVTRGEDGVELQMEFGDLVAGAVAALGTNYRVDAIEVALLGLFDEGNCGRVLQALIDWPVIAEFLQKKSSQEQTPAG